MEQNTHSITLNNTINNSSPRTPRNNKARSVSFEISVNVTSSIQNTVQRVVRNNNIATTSVVVTNDNDGANSESSLNNRNRAHTYSYDAYHSGDSGDELGSVSSGVKSEI